MMMTTIGNDQMIVWLGITDIVFFISYIHNGKNNSKKSKGYEQDG